MMMKRLVVLCCAFATLLSAITYQADFRTEEGRKEWKPNPLVTTGPDGFVLASEDASYFTGQVLHPNGGTIVGA